MNTLYEQKRNFNKQKGKEKKGREGGQKEGGREGRRAKKKRYIRNKEII